MTETEFRIKVVPCHILSLQSNFLVSVRAVVAVVDSNVEQRELAFHSRTHFGL